MNTVFLVFRLDGYTYKRILVDAFNQEQDAGALIRALLEVYPNHFYEVAEVLTLTAEVPRG